MADSAKPMTEPQPDYFREYHGVENRLRVTRVVAGIAVAATVIAIVTALSAGAPVSPNAGTPAPTVTAVAESVLPAPDASAGASAPLTPQPLPSTGPGPRTWAITIDTTGYQAEIDQCLWVRMDLGIQAPVVGAHNYCGGSVVLEMAIGDTVTLAGTGLDGTYRVASERLAYAGDNAAEATAGVVADVILQTCFWVDDGSERLIALQLA